MTTDSPNVLLICADHWAAEFLGVAGDASILTPGLDEIAQCGVRFTNAYCVSPLCCPSRAAIATGRYPHETG